MISGDTARKSKSRGALSMWRRGREASVERNYSLLSS